MQRGADLVDSLSFLLRSPSNAAGSRPKTSASFKGFPLAVPLVRVLSLVLVPLLKRKVCLPEGAKTVGGFPFLDSILGFSTSPFAVCLDDSCP